MRIIPDTSGNRVVARQCSSSPNESKQLKNYIRSVHGSDLTVLKFEVCNTDLCNVVVPRPQSSDSSGAVSMAASSLGLSLALGALAAHRLTV
ncbi:Protein of unknown function [Gryllus bimaculatus]|nr:Protein of unknown function [Gryllus bimaculatus]